METQITKDENRIVSNFDIATISKLEMLIKQYATITQLLKNREFQTFLNVCKMEVQEAIEKDNINDVKRSYTKYKQVLGCLIIIDDYAKKKQEAEKELLALQYRQNFQQTTLDIK